MYGGSGRVNPSEGLGYIELLRAKLPSNQNLSAYDLRCEPVKIRKLNELVFGELLLQMRTEPLGRVP